MTCVIALATGCAKKAQPPAGGDHGSAAPVTGSAAAPAGSAAPAPTTGSAAPAADDYDTHMKAGEALEDQKKWPEALAEFEAAVAKKPDDARALDEVAFTAYGAGKLDRAQDAAIAAAAAAKDDKKLHAVALFNLGLAVEKSQPYAAAQLYAASNAERPNRGVRFRLAKLQADSASAKPSKDELALLDKVGVKPAPATSAAKSSSPGSKEDQALMSALEGAGLNWDCGAGKCVLFVENVECTENHQLRPTSYECTAPAVKGKPAQALVAALAGKQLAPAKEHGDVTTYRAASVRCRSFDEGDSGAPDECDVTP